MTETYTSSLPGSLFMHVKMTFLVLLLLISFPSFGEEPAQVFGYGVKPCDDYLKVAAGAELGQEDMIAHYLKYQEWLAGLSTGLSLATGMDVLHGVEIKGAMRRVLVYCDDHPMDDFFNASMDLVRILGDLK